jgi:formyl-CoA transferase
MALDAEITRWSATKTRQTLLALTQAHGVICAPVNHLAEVVQDPHMTARGSLHQRRHDSLGMIAQMQTPLRLSGDTPPPLTSPPGLGADSSAVLHDLLGLSQADIKALVEQGAIAI